MSTRTLPFSSQSPILLICILALQSHSAISAYSPRYRVGLPRDSPFNGSVRLFEYLRCEEQPECFPAPLATPFSVFVGDSNWLADLDLANDHARKSQQRVSDSSGSGVDRISGHVQPSDVEADS